MSDRRVYKLGRSLKKPFLLPGANVEVAGLSLEILGYLECEAFVNQKLAGLDALWLLCHLVMHTKLRLQLLDPKFLSASKIYISPNIKTPTYSNILDLNNQTWLRHILQGLPCVDKRLNISEKKMFGSGFLEIARRPIWPAGRECNSRYGHRYFAENQSFYRSSLV